MAVFRVTTLKTTCYFYFSLKMTQWGRKFAESAFEMKWPRITWVIHNTQWSQCFSEMKVWYHPTSYVCCVKTEPLVITWLLIFLLWNYEFVINYIRNGDILRILDGIGLLKYEEQSTYAPLMLYCVTISLLGLWLSLSLRCVFFKLLLE